ncbi:MAG: (d)CMP kinase [Candidatus Aquicultorales bacterium]
MIITIDGPAGSGKSTVAKAVADALDIEYLDTGAMYRAVTWKALENGVDLANEEELAKLAESSTIRFTHDKSGSRRILIDGRDVADAIRSPQVNASVSVVSKVAGVRRELVRKQQALGGEMGSLVVEGRDAGTVIFPAAEVKVFLTASVEERARRRHKELVEKGYALELKEVIADIATRDRIDSTRRTSPLVQAADAVPIDTTDKSIGEVVAEIARLVEKARGGRV